MIRPAHPDDAPAIAAIWNHVIEHTAQTFTNAPKTADMIAGQMPAQPYIVAEDNDGQVLGFVTYFQFRGGPGYAYTVEHSVHLSPDARRRGLGRALMTACETHARTNGIHSIIAGISGENPGGVQFHAALGYTHIATLPQVGWKFDRWHDLVLMQKIL
jgi:phosphinothricin acetyltransferase